MLLDDQGNFVPSSIISKPRKVRGQTPANKKSSDSFNPVSIIKKFVAPDAKNIDRATVLPLKKNTDTGESSWAVPGFAMDSARAITKAGEIYRQVLNGEMSPDDPRAAMAATTLSMAGLGAGQFGSAPKGALRSMVGGRSDYGFDKKAVAKAREARSYGAEADEIWEKHQVDFSTGDAAMEISDHKMRWLEPSEKSNKKLGLHLDNHIDHPDLFRAYPELRKTWVMARDDLGPGEGGWNPTIKSISLNKDDLKNKTQRGLDTILHEIQHNIQDIEKWPGGGSYKHLKDIAEKAKGGPLTRAENLDTFKKYLAIPGERQSNQTMVRREMYPEYRKTTPPSKTSIETEEQMRAWRKVTDEVRRSYGQE